MMRSKQVWTNPLSPPQPSPHFFPRRMMAQPMNLRSNYSVIKALLLSCYIIHKSHSERTLLFSFLQCPKCITLLSYNLTVKWSEIMWVNSLGPGLWQSTNVLLCFLSFTAFLVLEILCPSVLLQSPDLFPTSSFFKSTSSLLSEQKGSDHLIQTKTSVIDWVFFLKLTFTEIHIIFFNTHNNPMKISTTY